MRYTVRFNHVPDDLIGEYNTEEDYDLAENEMRRIRKIVTDQLLTIVEAGNGNGNGNSAKKE